MSDKVRIPKQKRSIEKKEKIIDAAYHTFMKQGYFDTSINDIAKSAHLSVGTIYSYFVDKKDIFIQALYHYGYQLIDQICEKIRQISPDKSLERILHEIINLVAESHIQLSHKFHDECMSLYYVDGDVKTYFKEIELKMAESVSSELSTIGYRFSKPAEQSFLVFSMISGLNDVIAYNDRKDLDKKKAIDEACKIIMEMLVRNE